MTIQRGYTSIPLTQAELYQAHQEWQRQSDHKTIQDNLKAHLGHQDSERYMKDKDFLDLASGMLRTSLDKQAAQDQVSVHNAIYEARMIEGYCGNA